MSLTGGLHAAQSILAGAVRQAAGALGVNLYKYTSDRRFLEGVIFPYLAAAPDIDRILFVGCAWYTAHYPSIFAHKALTTLDLDPHVRAFGAARHITGHLERIGAHFEPGTLDAIVASGVIGWGLNEPAAIELALGACVDALRPGGLLILGWNDVPNRRPIIPREARAVAAVAPFDFPPIGRSAHLCAGANRHTFDFFTKPEPTR